MSFHPLVKPAISDKTLNTIFGWGLALGLVAFGVFLQTVHINLLTVLGWFLLHP